MSEYFSSQEDAEKFLINARDYKATFFAKVRNHGDEKWMVSYHSRRDILSSPYIQVLEDHSGEILHIAGMPRPKCERELEEKRNREELRRKERLERERELKRIVSIKAHRKANGACIMCGNRLGIFAKLAGQVQHGTCKQFRDEPPRELGQSATSVSPAPTPVIEDRGGKITSTKINSRADHPGLKDPLLPEAIRALTSHVTLHAGAVEVKGAGSEGVVMLAVEQFRRLHDTYPDCYELHYAYAAALQVAMQGKTAEDVLSECVNAHSNEWLARETLKQKALYNWNPFFLPEFASSEGSRVHPLINNFVRTNVLVATRQQLLPKAVLFLRDSSNELPVAKLCSCKIEFITTISTIKQPQVIAINGRIHDDPSNPYQCEVNICPFGPFGSGERFSMELFARQDTFEFVVLDVAGIVTHIRRITPSARMQAVHLTLARMFETTDGAKIGTSESVAAIRKHQSIFDPKRISY